jgi:hypothetical protein
MHGTLVSCFDIRYRLQKKDTDLLAETLHEGGNQELERSFGVEPEHIFLTGAAVNSRILLFFFKEVFSDLKGLCHQFRTG